eukprot:TRINITY_DN7838_c0_g1_i1.p1 TRINITY_DN7838_c0_g1~~TRINITY_DN7838_c0_g1_i1.p1  ORF type:complete len:151 (+),score=4.44 TRINITY_DN7838_c0_g1_i1:50-502(+)
MGFDDVLSSLRFVLLTSSGVSTIAHYCSIFTGLVLILLSIIAFCTSNTTAGTISLIFGLFVAVVEGSKYIPPLLNFLDFFLDSFIWRAVAYFILSFPTFTNWVTAFGGVMLLISSGLYAYAWWRGEKGISKEPVVRTTVDESQEPFLATL